MVLAEARSARISGEPIPEDALYIYEPFENEVNASEMNFSPCYEEGQFGNCLVIPDGGRGSYKVWDEFLQEATVMAWVKPADINKKIMFWCNDNNYPSAFYYPDHNYRLCMHFCYEGPTPQPYGYLTRSMDPDKFYHLVQSWGPDGFKGYVNGQLLFHNTQQFTGVTEAISPGTPLTHQILYLANGLAGGCYDDFAIFTRQLTDGQIETIANLNDSIGSGEANLTFPVIPIIEEGWTQLCPLPTRRSDLGAVDVGGDLYVIGGFDHRAPVHVVHGGNRTASIVYPLVAMYDLATDQWQPLARLPQPRTGFSTVVVDEKIYVIGGGDGNNNYSDILEYDPATDRWKSIAELPDDIARSSPAAAVLNGEIYLIGGLSADGSESLEMVYVYNLDTDKWRTVAPLQGPRTQAATVTLDGRIYAIGGHNDISPREYLDSVEAYDPETDTWEFVASMALRRSCITSSATVLDGKIYIFGGWDGGPRIHDLIEMYDPETDHWVAVGRAPVPTNRVSAVTIDGAIYLLGGQDKGAIPYGTLERYVPE